MNYLSIVTIDAIIIGKSYSHQEKGVKNYRSELTINTLVHYNNFLYLTFLISAIKTYQ